MSDEPKSGEFESSDAEPTASLEPMPVWPFVLTLVMLFLCAVYFDSHGAWFNDQIYGPYKSSDELTLYQPKSGEADMLARGKAAYDSVCGLCHGLNGEGKPGQAPPLAGSEWVAKDVASLAHVPLTGLNGSIQVKGQKYNLSMPPMGAAMSDAKLAAALSYIRTSWGNQGSLVTAAEIKKARAGGGVRFPPPAAWAKMTRIERGQAVFNAYGCANCHGPAGKGGVANPNAKTAQQVPPLIHVADGYSKSELIAFIKKGERNIPRLNPNGPAPPKFMPAWGSVISNTNLDYLADYLFSLKPKEEDLGF